MNSDIKKTKILVAAFGDPGHAFPAIALAKTLKSRGHDVTVETWSKWKGAIESEGLLFASAPEYIVFPTDTDPLKPYQAAVRATRQTRDLITDLKPDLVISDVITIAPALAAELEGIPWLTIIPHLFHQNERGLPPFGMGSEPPKTAIGKTFWKSMSTIVNSSVNRGRRDLNGARERLGLQPQSHSYGSVSRELSLVASFPQLEYQRKWPEWAKVVGPFLWEPPVDEIDLLDIRGEGPLIVVAPSTSQDPGAKLLIASLESLEGRPFRVLVPTKDFQVKERYRSSENITIVDWLKYSKIMPHVDLVICHGGHGTVAHALSNGVPLLVVPSAGDMAETAARIQWVGAGLYLHKSFLSKAAIRSCVSKLLCDGSYKHATHRIKEWHLNNNGPLNASKLIEQWMEPLSL